MKDPVGVFGRRRGFSIGFSQVTGGVAAPASNCPGGSVADLCPVGPRSQADPPDRHYDEIACGFGVGELRPPTSPMSDDELSKAIADFLKDAPSSEAVSNLGRRFNPSSGV